MTDQVEESERRVRYEVLSPGGETFFGITFPISEIFDRNGVQVSPISVYVNGIETDDYSVDYNTLRVQLDMPAVQSSIVTIEGQRLVKRIKGYPLRGSLKSALLNGDINSIIEMLQEMRRDIGRTFIKNKAEADEVSGVFPQWAPGKVIFWDPAVKQLVNGPDVSGIEDAADILSDALAFRNETEDARDAAQLAQAAAEEAAAEAGAAVTGVVKVSGNDTTAGTLETKILPGTGITMSTQNDGGNETRTVSASLASQAEAEAGSNNTKLMTPLRVAEAIAAIAGPGGGGAGVPLKTITAANSTTVEFIHGSGGVVLDATYKAYIVILESVIPTNDGQALYLRTGNGGAFDSGGTDYGYRFWENGSNIQSSAAFIPISTSVGSPNGASLNGAILMFQPSNAALRTIFNVQTNWLDTSNNESYLIGTGSRRELAAHDRLRFYFSTGNISSGIFTLYGAVDA